MWLRVRFISRILTLPVPPFGFHQNENLMAGKNSLLFHIDLEGWLVSILESIDVQTRHPWEAQGM